MATPNILIILADDLGVDSFRIDNSQQQVIAEVDAPGSIGGSVRLRNFERMLVNGIHFGSAWAHPVCTPTRASLWTGMQAWKTGFGYPAPAASESLPKKAVTGAPIVTLAQALKSKTQYRCAMFGKWDLGSNPNPVQVGWDYFAGIFGGGLRPVWREYGFPGPPAPARVGYNRLKVPTDSKKPNLCTEVAAFLTKKYDKTFLQNNPDLRYYIWHKDVVESDGTVLAQQPPTDPKRKDPYATADQIADAKQWITSQAGTPWCVALNLIAPHDPYHLPPPGTYPTTKINDPANPTVQEMLVAMMESMDHYVGDLLQAIDNQLGNTVIIFAGDNGTQDIDPDTLSSVDRFIGDDKNHVAVGGVHVPMIIADGGRMKGGAPCYTKTSPQSVSDPVHIIDVYRTVLDIAGVVLSKEEAAEIDSISIAPHLIGTQPERAYNFSQMYQAPLIQPDPDVPGGQIAYSPGVGATISDGNYKLNCSVLLAGDTPNTYLVDENGAKTTTPVYSYEFVQLTPEPGIVGSLVETPIASVIARSGSDFVITDPTYRDTICKLYEWLSRERLDNLQTPFPIIVDSGTANE